MKIIEALKELPLIEKKILRNTENLRKYSSNLDLGEDTDLPFKTVKDQQQEVDSLIQSNIDLVKVRGSIRRRLAITNATTLVTIGGVTNSITEWIELREKSIEFLLNTYRNLNDSVGAGQIQRLSGSTFDMTKGVKILRFYSEKDRNAQIESLEDLRGAIDSSLEMVNATTDLKDVA